MLRKKDNQVSFLHLYHHTVMPMISWGASKYYPGGHGTFIGVINSFVHIVMYFYYMLAAMGPEFQKYLWWKHWITNLQMVSVKDRTMNRLLCASGLFRFRIESKIMHSFNSTNVYSKLMSTWNLWIVYVIIDCYRVCTQYVKLLINFLFGDYQVS